MYSSTVLASLLASAHGFAVGPSGDCYFAYSVDYTMIFELGSLVGITDPVGQTSGLIGQTFAGVELTITKGGEEVRPAIITAPNQFPQWTVFSEEFCLEEGTYSTKTTASTASNYTYWSKMTLGEMNSPFLGVDPALADAKPFRVLWAIFPNSMREAATAATANPYDPTAPAVTFYFDNLGQALDYCSANYEGGFSIPLAVPPHVNSDVGHRRLNAAPTCDPAQ